jgi:hypothetical protein
MGFQSRLLVVRNDLLHLYETFGRNYLYHQKLAQGRVLVPSKDIPSQTYLKHKFFIPHYSRMHSSCCLLRKITRTVAKEPGTLSISWGALVTPSVQHWDLRH